MPQIKDKAVIIETPDGGIDELPDDLIISGKAMKDGGFDARREANCPSVVLEFRRKTVFEVREGLKAREYDWIVITRIG